MRALTRVKIRFYTKAIPQYLLVLTMLAVTAWVTDKWVESISFAVSFLVLRYAFRDAHTDALHCNTTLKCMLLTNGIILVFIPITIPISNSIFGGVISAFGVNYIAHLLSSSYARISERQELQRLQQEKTLVDIRSLSEPDLRLYCKAHGLDDIDTEIVVQRLIYHLRGNTLYSKIGYSKPQMIRREHRIQEVLGIPLK